MVSCTSNRVTKIYFQWWSEANTGLAFVFFYWILTPIFYFTNTWFAGYLPISSFQTFDNTGMPYDPNQIVTGGEFDVTKYRAYSPLYMSTTLFVSYGLAFASFSSIIVHTFCKILRYFPAIPSS